MNKEISKEQLAYLEARKVTAIKIRLIQIIIFVVFLCLWQFASSKKIINPFIFSSPERIFICFCQMVVDKTLFRHVGLTLMETFISFFLVFALSVGISVLLWWNKTLSSILEPYLVVLNSLPKSALAPLLLVWFGATIQMILITAVSVVIFGSILNIYTGFQETDPDKLMLIRTLRGNKWHCLKLVVIPGSIPILFGVMKSNIGLCLVGVIIAEFMGARAGLGYLIIYSSQVFPLAGVFEILNVDI
ncbi:MAG: ABC transporter permease [Lachnospiraceae bacterium]|nr:ABC transporter permease [Lachnospiraceae bacterium]